MGWCLSKHVHPSKRETIDCNLMMAELQGKKILECEVWPVVELHVEGKLWKKWEIDQGFMELDGSKAYYESKGWNRSDDNFKLKLAAYLIQYPNIPIYVNWDNFISRTRAELTPGLRLMHSGVMSRIKKKKPKPYYYKTYSRELKRWVTKKIGDKK